MTKEVTTRPQDIKNVKFYKKASFPWAIIISLLISVLAFIAGWHTHQAQTDDVKAQAANLVDVLAKKDQK